MSSHTSNDKSVAVRRMFDRIARNYDLMNRLMTFGQDRVWRQTVARMSRIEPEGRLLDIGTGTGGIARDALSVVSPLSVTAVDFSFEMMQTGRRLCGTERIQWCAADALHLPFADNRFDAVTSGYLIRNVTDARAAFAEQRRVVKPGGRIVCLDTSPPKKNLIYPLVLLHLKAFIPLLGALVSGDIHAYTYLPDSTRAFLTPKQLAATMASAGLVEISYRTFMFGTIAVHVGSCPRY